jgi:hypothetical protein
MTAPIYPLAVRFADLWAVDPHQMVEEIYSPAIHMESMAKLGQPAIEGAAALHALEDRLALMIPEHRHELVRLVAGKRHACLETTVVGPTTGEYAPACVWWWLGDDGKVDREVGYFDWGDRVPDAHRAHGTVPPNDNHARGDERWYRDFASAIGDAWQRDPASLVERHFSSGCIVERVGVSRLAGHTEVRLAVERSCVQLPLEERWLDVDEMAADGNVVAVLFRYGTSRAASRGSVVLTLDSGDRIASLRWYANWSSTVSLVGRPAVGSP